MIKYGKTNSGKQRWFCKNCNSSFTQRRKDLELINIKKLFINWILGTESLKEKIKYKIKSRETYSRKFKYFWNNPPKVEIPEKGEKIYLLDAKFIQGRKYSVHICSTTTEPIYWSFYEGENYLSWNNFISKLPEPDFVIIDGHNGILSAIKHFWPSTRVQRCIFHIIKHSRNKLTKKSNIKANQELRKLIVNDLIKVRTKREKRTWIKRFRKWERKYDKFLKEKTYSSNLKTKTGRQKWWYTHKTLRGIRSHINNALPFMFTYVRYPNIPRTTNFLEGGINKSISELISRHRGISLKQKASLITYFLDSKKKKK